MATLIEDVDATETDWLVSADIPVGTDYLTVEDEIVMISARFPAQLDPQTQQLSSTRLRVERGAGGTTAATHANGTTLTPLIPPSSGGAGGDLPDPATGNVGDVPTVNAGQDAYELTQAVGAVLSVSRTLTSAEILALDQTPVELVAGTPDVVYWPVAAFIRYNFVTTGYTGGPDLLFGTAAGWWMLKATVFNLDLIVDSLTVVGPPPFAWQETAPMIGEALVIYSSDAYTVGDGTLDLTVLYRAVDVS